MGKHTYFGHNRRVTMINHLKSLLDYHEESYSNSEIYSYSNKEIKQLINRYKIVVINGSDPNNSWYGSRRHYIQKPYNFIDNPSHQWYRTTYAKQFDY